MSFYFPHQLLAVVASSLVSLSLALSTGWSLEQRGAPPPAAHPQLPGECMLKGHTWQGEGRARKLGQSRAPEPRKWITGGSLKPEGLAWVSNVGSLGPPWRHGPPPLCLYALLLSGQDHQQSKAWFSLATQEGMGPRFLK